MRRIVLAALGLMLLLPGCGLRPVYSGGSKGFAATTLHDIELGPIPGQAGWLVRNALSDRLGQSSGPARYKLDVQLDDQITGLGIRSDNAVTRERRVLRARYTLTDAATGAVLLDLTEGADAGIDVAASEYATVAAEQSALERLSTAIADQIVTRLALFARQQAEGTARPAP